MKKTIAISVVSLCLSFAGGIAVAEAVHDWHAIEEVHEHVQQALHELEEARKANHYDMKGHGEKAEEHLRMAERELHEGIEAAKAAK